MTTEISTRRSFLIGGCCSLHLLSVKSVAAQIPERAFICSALEPPREADATPAPSATSLTPYGTAFVSDRWRKGDGNTSGTDIITLGVYFMDGGPNQKTLVQNSASKWLSGELGQIIAFDFEAPRHRAQIRVSFASGEGNWSYVGRNNKSINPLQKTMNIEDAYERVVLHEFGHALGLQHEHMNPGAPIVWNEEVVIADMAAQGWPESMTRSNIISRYASNAACIGDPNFNRESIMMYPIPSRWTKNGVSFNQTNSISDRDRSCLKVIYKV